MITIYIGCYTMTNPCIKQNQFLVLLFAKSLTTCTFLFCLLSCSTTKTEQDNLENSPGPYVVEEGESQPPTVIGYEDYSDPLEYVINRPFFWFNDKLYRYFLSPVSQGYDFIMPEVAFNGVSNFFSNLREPLYSVNYLLQAKPGRSGKSILRLVINSTLGILGFFDPAEAWMGLEKERTTLSDTLALYGLGYGAYIIVPILGPSDIRDITSMASEYLTHPLNYIEDTKTARYLFVYEGFHDQVPRLSNYSEILAQADDSYIYVRNLYLQGILRDAQAMRNKKFKKSGGDQEVMK